MLRILPLALLCAGCDRDKDVLIGVRSIVAVDCVVLADGAPEIVTVPIGTADVSGVEVCDADGVCAPSADWWMDGGQVMIADCADPYGWAVVTYIEPYQPALSALVGDDEDHAVLPE